MAYTKLPSGLTVPPESPGVEVAKKTVTQLFKHVKWTCAVVCRAFGKGNEISCGLKLGSTDSACGMEDGAAVVIIEVAATVCTRTQRQEKDIDEEVEWTG